MPLNRISPRKIHRDAHRFARLRSPSFAQSADVQKNIAAFLRIRDCELPDFGPIMSRHMQ